MASAPYSDRCYTYNGSLATAPAGILNKRHRRRSHQSPRLAHDVAPQQLKLTVLTGIELSVSERDEGARVDKRFMGWCSVSETSRVPLFGLRG